jgi:hypothetical protein
MSADRKRWRTAFKYWGKNLWHAFNKNARKADWERVADSHGQSLSILGRRKLTMTLNSELTASKERSETRIREERLLDSSIRGRESPSQGIRIEEDAFFCCSKLKSISITVLCGFLSVKCFCSCSLRVDPVFLAEIDLQSFICRL